MWVDLRHVQTNQNGECIVYFMGIYVYICKARQEQENTHKYNLVKPLAFSFPFSFAFCLSRVLSVHFPESDGESRRRVIGVDGLPPFRRSVEAEAEEEEEEEHTEETAKAGINQNSEAEERGR